MPYLDSNIPSNIYYESIGSGILRFARTTSYINTFVTLSHCLLKRIEKQGNKHRFMSSMLNGTFGKNLAVFNVFTDSAANFVKPFSLPSIRAIHVNVCLLHSLFLLFFWLFVWLSYYFYFCLNLYITIILL